MSDQVRVGEWTGDMFTAVEWMMSWPGSKVYDAVVAKLGEDGPEQEFVDAYMAAYLAAEGEEFEIPLCSADVDGCHTGPEFGPCASCEESFQRDLRREAAEYRMTPMSVTDPKRYREGLIEAGRGHLVRER